MGNALNKTDARPIPVVAHEESLAFSKDNESMWLDLEQDGFVVIPGVVEQEEIQKALRIINRSLGRHAPIREQMCPDCGNAKEIISLMSNSTLKGILETLIGPFSGGGGGQIALRFPGDNCGPDFEINPDVFSHWHIDGLPNPKSTTQNGIPIGDISNFTALVGVLLQDVPDDNMGNLVVYPGSHFELQNYFQAVGFEDVLTYGTGGLPRLRFSRPLVQVRGKAGDVVIVNYLTAHLVAPNVSPNIRYCVYFRLKSASFAHERRTRLHRPESMLDAWCDWPGLARARALRNKKKTKEIEAEREDIQQAVALSLMDTQPGVAHIPGNSTLNKVEAHHVTTYDNNITEDNKTDDDEFLLRAVIERSKSEY
jgi:hypothetical protein